MLLLPTGRELLLSDNLLKRVIELPGYDANTDLCLIADVDMPVEVLTFPNCV